MQDTNAEQIQTIAQEYFDSRPNKDVSHKKLAVFFIACPGSGKSSLRAQIVAQLNATYVCNDEVRTILSERGLPAELLRPIVRTVWERINTGAANKFIVFDGNVSASFAEPNSYLNLTKNNNYEIFMVLFEAKPETLIARIAQRDGANGSYLIDDMSNQIKRYNNARTALRADYVLGEEAEYGELLKLIKQRLSLHESESNV